MSKNYYNPAFDGTWPIQSAAAHSGVTYTGTMTIKPAEHDGHSIEWKTSAGDYEGMGLIIEGKLFLAFGKTEEGFGLAVYAEKPDGIESVFTSQAFKGSVGKEKVPECKSFANLNTTYKMNGTQPDNKKYSGKVGFVAYGDLFLMTWGFDGDPGQLVGVGMIRHGRFVTGYGFRDVYTFGCGCYELLADGTMKGEWAIPSFRTTVNEVYGRKSE